MQYISQLICLISFLVLTATSCMARTVVNQAGIDGSPHRLVKRSTSDCVNTTIYPSACAANCTLSFMRYGSNLGISFITRDSITGINAITGISDDSTITFTASTTRTGTIITYARIAGLAGSFFSANTATGTTVTIGGTSTTIPVFPTGAAVTGITTITFVTHNNVTTAVRFSGNSGNPPTKSNSTSGGGTTIRVCAPLIGTGK